MRYTYSRWDGTQEVAEFDADELMDALSDDLMSDGDVQSALQRVVRWGLQSDGEQRALGLQALLQRLRAQRQQELERYNLDATLQDIRDQVDDVVQTEREGIERRLEEVRRGAADGDDPQAGALAMLEEIARRKQHLLDDLPEDLAPRITALADYEFFDELARSMFEALLDTLQQQVLQSHWESMAKSLQRITDGSREELKNMLRDMNEMLRGRLAGGEPDFDRFMAQYGRHFPGAGSLDRLVGELQQQAAHMESLLRSMSPAMRRSLESLMQSVLRDEALREELAQLNELLQTIAPLRRPQPQYPFSGQESLTLEEALQLMRRLHDLEQLERDLRRAQDSGNLELIDGAQVEHLMGKDAEQAVTRLQQLTQVLERAGYVERTATSFELTPRGVRKIGQKALQDIFRHLKHDAFGNHPALVRGAGGDQTDDTKRYEFGDAFLLDLDTTLMNSVLREGQGSPLRLAVDDFEVFCTEYLTRSSTVLMLDMSRSMPLRGCFIAAKKVAFALSSLIRLHYPRDRLHIIGFSDFARELRPESLHHITWGDYVYGTNMQHGFMLARRLLSRQKSSNKQIILITDGEPTAHFEGGRVQFSYPPTFRTFQETLREVQRCTREGIVINTFMLERSHYLADFVNQMTRINRGRAFFATPERLGDYILVDYVASKQHLARVRASGA